jgi:two-component system, sensor histidine kinase RegB
VLHVVLIAMLLPWRLAFAGTLLVLANVALALAWAEPLHHLDGRPVSHSWIVAAAGASFAVTSLVVAWFVLRIVTSLREHEALLREAARRALNDEMVLRMGTLAAGAAHELGTPLTTMAVVVADMAREAPTPERAREAEILGGQLEACRHALANLRAAAGHASVGGAREKLDEFVAALVTRFRAMRPDVALEVNRDGSLPAPEIFADASLRQAILVLLNNAADASPSRVELDVRWNARTLTLRVGDRGRGVPAEAAGKLGRDFFTTKPPGKGTGLGLVLTASAVSRLGGSVHWTNRPDGGLWAQVELPLSSLGLGATAR